MPTGMHWYYIAAEKFGKVDRKDEKAVEDFFVIGLNKLPKKTKYKVFDYLLKHDGPAKVPPNCDCWACIRLRKLMNEKKAKTPISLFVGKDGAQPIAIALDHVAAAEWDYARNPVKILIRTSGGNTLFLDKENGEEFFNRLIAFKMYQSKGI